MSALVGADLATHGAIVDSNGKVLYVYEDVINLGYELEDMDKITLHLASFVPLGSNVAVDWDKTTYAWGNFTNKAAIIKNAQISSMLTLLAIMFGMHCRYLRKCTIRFITPAQVRQCLGLKRNCDKSEVHKATEHLMPPTIAGKCFPRADVRGDKKDAWILTHVWSCATKKE